MSKSKDKFQHASYLQPYIRASQREMYFEASVKALALFKYDTLAFRGISGALVAPVLAFITGKELIVVRRETDFMSPINEDKRDSATHSSHLVEGHVGTKRYIIVDDFVSTGATAAAIHKAIKDINPKAKCLGVLEMRYMDYELPSINKGIYKLTPLEE